MNPLESGDLSPPYTTFAPVECGLYSSEAFLEILNCGTPEFPFREKGKHSFTQDIHLFVVGPSADPRLRAGVLKWLEEHIPPFGGRDEICAIMIASCGGTQYTLELMERIRERYPRITWSFPLTRQFYVKVYSDLLAEDLITKGVLRK